MGTKYTTYRVNQELKDMIKMLAKREGGTLNYIHRKALEAFYNSSDRHVHPQLLITQSTHPDYVYRGVVEHVDMSPEMHRMMDELVEINGNCHPSTVFFHAALIYVTQQLSK